jgi:hypothetical protein
LHATDTCKHMRSSAMPSPRPFPEHP